MKHLYMKGSILSLTAVLTGTTLLAGCASSGDKSKESSETGASAKRGSISVTLYDRGNVPPEAGTITNNMWTKWINDKGPVDVKFVPFPRSEQVQKLNLLFASGEAPDLIMEYDGGFFNQLYSQKQLMPLDELIAKYSTSYKKLTEKYPQLLTLGQKDDGKTYNFGRILGAKNNDFIFVRKDWLTKLHLEVPKTSDELFQVAKAFRENDPDGNGQKDTFGLNIGGASAESVVNSMFNNASRFVKDGKLVNPNIGEQAKAAAKFQKDLFDGGIIDKDFLTDKNGEKAKQDWVNGKLGFYFASGGVDSTSLLDQYKSLLKNVSGAEVIAIPVPAGPFGQFNPGFKSPIQMTGGINAAAKDPVAVMKYIDFLVEQDTIMTLKNGIEGVHYTKNSEGITSPIDAEKNKKEMVGVLDLSIMSSIGTLPKGEQVTVKVNPSIPAEKQFAEIMKMADGAYFNPKNDYAYPITNWPGLPSNLQVINKSVSTINDIWKKSIVGGTQYSTDQALVDVQSLWNKSGGQQIDQFYSDWITKNADKVIYNRDFITTINKQ
ncbi:extracellular solute-binding protein [Paenibacillus alginolyticus]|uniref:Extracellular solute-binding protein n=1 Tax=Paenibacillus alginolyticus TaxID=59839 RepID=A0ABT4GPS1_9BACL|nr:extracellular solute-binding protein [Paenibacillus alginolyticus]MCY9670467.1 extracellular solute-binding protein [Paenibacillus alginolyticus]MCY9698225.1 extracellular solute-binding protein [Paenibacillus alginolyticus]MEC0147749.1 extracellular solute-binding protein [Paenibacillus alginolyticus]